MEWEQVVRTRRMVRSYDAQRPVPRATVQKLLNLAIRAPSAGHTQGWHFLVLDDITSRSAFWTATTEAPDPTPSAVEQAVEHAGAGDWLSRMRTAPVLIVCFSDEQAYRRRYAEPDKSDGSAGDRDWAIPYWHVDTGMAALILLLGAQDEGLGACFFGVPAARWSALFSAFAVPDGLTPVGVVSLGHPAPDRRSPSLRRGRRPVADVVSYGSFG